MYKTLVLFTSGLSAGLMNGMPGRLMVVVASIAALGLNTARALPTAEHSSDAKAPSRRSVKITAKRDGDVTRFCVQNDELCDVTVTFDLATKHLKSTVSFPHTAVFPPGKVSEAFIVEPDGSGGSWEYSYTNYYKLGSCKIQHDDSVVYQLPYAPGHRHKVTQAANGKFSHKGSNRYAVDWKMPVGTPVHAARGGIIVKTRSDSDRGGPSMSFDKYNNYVLIEHDDGTLGHYCHLSKGTVRVKPGQRVHEGDLLAASGNTGFSSGPHLHFCVFRTKNGRERESVPVRFRTTEAEAVSLIAGRNYEAASTRTASAAVGVIREEAGQPTVGSGAGRAL